MVLCILDGFGDAPAGDTNAIAQARTPNYDRMLAENATRGPRAFLETSGLSVGLPDGQMGNSEVGHMNIGAGRVVMQDLPRIDASIASGEIADAPSLRNLISALKKSGGTCHLMGLVSPGGVHSHQDHMVALAKIVAAEGVPVRIHAFLDGRDTPPTSGRGFLEAMIKDLGDAAGIATMTGRYYAMDRDKNWDRVGKAFRAICQSEGVKTGDFPAALDTCYAADTGDEFVLPHVAEGYKGVKDGDALLMANFRADRAREILTALVDPGFDGFERGKVCDFAAKVGLTEYSDALTPFMQAMFPAPDIANTIGECVADAGLKQLRIAETEKYAHVTFFLNGGREAVFEGEDRKLIPSPKVATYDLKPEMSAHEVTDGLVEAIEARPMISLSSISPILTWSVTPEFYQPQSRLSKPLMRVWDVWKRRWQARAVSCWLPPTTAILSACATLKPERPTRRILSAAFRSSWWAARRSRPPWRSDPAALRILRRRS